MFYELTYQLKGEKELIKETFYKRDEVLYIIKQINRGITTIKDKIINGIESLDSINVICIVPQNLVRLNILKIVF